MTENCNNEDDTVQQNRLAFVTNRAETLNEIAARSVFQTPSLRDCVDPTSQVQSEKRRSSQTPGPIEVNGIYTSNAVQSLSNEFEKNIVAERDSGTPINRAVRDFGDSFYDSLNNLNRFIVGQDLSQFPTLNDRITRFPEITPIEYAEFINEFLYTPTVTNVNINFNPTLVITQLDEFYTKNFTQSAIGGFCALMPQVFGAVRQFFTAINVLSQGISGIIAKLRERAIQELMRRISQEVAKIIDQTIGKVLRIITNFDIRSVFEDVGTFVNEEIVGRLVDLKERVLTFFTEENLTRVRNRVQNLIEYAVNVFQNPTLEEIEFLVYRFCSFAAQVEALINGLKDPLTFFAGNYRETIRNLTTASNANTARAIRAGAIRYTDSARRDLINTAEERLLERTDGVPLQPSIEDFVGIPTWEEVSSGRSSAFVVDLSQESFSGRSRFQRQDEGWTGLDHYKFLPKLVRLQREYGKRMTINSGYRSPGLNANIIPPGARNSLHVHGFAVDIGERNAIEKNRIAAIAFRLGFNQVLTDYSWGLHIGLIPDTRVVRETRAEYDRRIEDSRRRGTLNVPL
jgi:hypothetical protein